MKKFLLIAALLWAAPLFGQDVPLTPSGDGVKTVIVASKFPFTISAPPGAVYYSWSVPQGVTYARKLADLTITAAPAGELVVSVDMVTIVVDFKAQTFVTNTKSGSVTVQVGAVTPPKPPDPPPTPAQKVAWAIVVEDTAARTVQSAAVLGDVALWNSLGVEWHHYDLSEPLPAGIGDVAKKAGSYPALVLLGVKGANGVAPFIRAVPLPLSKDALKAEVAK